MSVLSLTTVVSAALVGVNNRMFKIERELRSTFPRRGDNSDSDDDDSYVQSGGEAASGLKPAVRGAAAEVVPEWSVPEGEGA